MGVPGTQYFIDKVGGGSSSTTLEKLSRDVADPALWKDPSKPPITPQVKGILETGLRDVEQAKKLGMPPDVIEARARRALEAVFAANENVPFDHTYDIRDIAVQKHIDPNGKFENYSKDVITDLHDQGVTFSEQSVSMSKLEKRFTPEVMDDAHKKAQAEGKDSKLDFLVMAPTSETLAAKDGKPETPESKKSKTEMDDRLKKVLMRPDVKGMDVAGPEAARFTDTGMAWFTEKYKMLQEVAQAKGEKMVLRPHVGEGYDPNHTGEHVEIAQANMRKLIETLETLGYDGSGDVIVRFGHGTHATPELMGRMAKLGIIVEANVGSNIATGSVLSAGEHPLLANMFYGVKTVLATDAQGVMGTTLTVEYQRAQQLISQFKAGEPIEIDGKKVFYKDLTAAQKERFSVDWLKNELKDYQRRAGEPITDGGDRGGGGGGGGGGGPHDGPPSEPSKESPKKKQAAVDEQVKRIEDLDRRIKTGSADDKLSAQAELDALKANPDWQAAFKLADLFESAKAQQGAKSVNPETKTLSDNIEGLLAAQDKARVGKDPVLQGKRDRFERALALEILKDGPVRQAVDAELEKLCAKALDYIQKTRSAAEQQEAMAALSTSAKKGYGGGLGTGDKVADADMMMTVLQTGNIRERMLALQNFANILGADVLKPEGRKKLAEMAQQEGATGDKQYSADDAKRIVARAIAYEKDTPSEADRSTKGLYNPLSGEKGAGDRFGDYASAKKQDMDTKLPPLLQEKVNEFLGRKLAAEPGVLAPKGEESPLARTTITVEQAMAQGLQLSDREIKAAGGLKAPLNWVVGQRANIINPEASFIRDAKNNSMPLKAGVSGTTYRWMQIVDMLGGDPNLGRLAAIAALQAADAHSFHEIASAAKGFGVGYDPSNPYGNVGIPSAQLEGLAESVGTTLDELNGKTPGDKPAI